MPPGNDLTLPSVALMQQRSEFLLVYVKKRVVGLQRFIGHGPFLCCKHSTTTHSQGCGNAPHDRVEVQEGGDAVIREPSPPHRQLLEYFKLNK